MDFADEITLTGVRAFGRHGVYDEERRDGQQFVVDATLYVGTRRAAETDDVADTIHYGEVAERIVATLDGRYELLRRAGFRAAPRCFEVELDL